ncbi:MAG: AarF/UbiB family protein [Desulfobacteraceae bacterium]
MLSIKKIGSFGRTYRNVVRYQQILSIIFKYGFGNIVDALKIDQYIEVGLKFINRERKEKIERHSGSERIRMCFEELGPTFIKLGQILSSRPDLVPVYLLEELSKLQDHVPPFEYDEVVKTVVAELGKNPEDVFETIEEEPLAAASIAQVHKATLKGGQDVAVKVQRPGIKKTVQVDLEIMHHLATLMEAHVEELAHHRPVKIVEEFAKTIEKELDFTIELSSTERMGRQFEKDRTVHIPRVFTDESSEKILTMEYVGGIKVSDIEAIDRAGMNRKIITKRGADFTMKQVFEYGFFHADPHPGNIFVLPGNVICPVDYGMTGYVNKQMREVFVDLLHGVASGNTRLAARLLLEVTDYDEKPDMDDFEREIAGFITKHLSKSLKDIQVGKMVNAFLEICSKNGVRIPADLFLMIKAFVAVEGIARNLDPKFDMISHAAPYVREVKIKRYSPSRMAEEASEIAKDSFRLLKVLPSDIMDIVRLAKQGRMDLNIKITGLEKMLATQDQTSNRIAFAIIIAAIILGSSQLVVSNTPPVVFGVSLIGIVGFITAAVMGLWLIVAILRSGKL